jgi:nicotinic acid mononucleotide adenylyltransferase
LACAHRVIPVPSVAIAARDVRARARRGESIADLVPPAVAEYIAARGLYREG